MLKVRNWGVKEGSQRWHSVEGSWDVGNRKGKEDLELTVPKFLHLMHVIKIFSAFL